MASSLDALLGQLRKLQQGAPYDASLATAIQNAQRQSADIDRQYTMGRSDVGKAYEDLSRDIGVQRVKNVSNTQGRFADTGLLHSGIHATAQGDVESDYQRGMSEAAQRRLAGYRSLDEGRRESESGIQDMLVGAQQDYSRRQAEAAQERARTKAEAEARAAQNARDQAAAAQNAAALRALAASMSGGGGGYGGGGGMGGGGGRYTGSTGGSRAPKTGEMMTDARGRGIMMSRPGLADAKSFDQKFNEAMKAYGKAGGQNFLKDVYVKGGVNRSGGLTAQQRALLTPAERRLFANQAKQRRLMQVAVSKNPKISDQDTAIAKIYDTLVADLGQGNKATAGIFSRGGASLGSAYGGASEALTGTQTALTDRLTKSLSGLGLQAALPQVLTPLSEQFAYDQGKIAKERGTNLGSLSKQGTAYQAIGQLGIGNAHKEKAQTRVSAMERLQKVLADLEAERIRAEAAIEQQRLENEVRLAQQRAANRASSGGGGSMDPLDALRAQKMGLEIQEMEQELMGGGKSDKPQEFYGGQRGLAQFLNSPSAYWGKAANTSTRKRIENIISTTQQRYGQGNQFSSGGRQYSPQGLSQLDIALIGAQNTRGSRINNEALRMALELYYGKGSKL